jgi:hypothetical protein
MPGNLLEITEFFPADDSADLVIEIYTAKPHRVHLADVVVRGKGLVMQFPGIDRSGDVSVDGFLEAVRRAAAIGRDAAARFTEQETDDRE